MPSEFDLANREHKRFTDTNGAKKVMVVDQDGNAQSFTSLVYSTNDIDEASVTVTYIGKEDADGNWFVMKIDTSSGTAFTYATITNNPTQTTGYADAWADRATLTYSAYSTAF